MKNNKVLYTEFFFYGQVMDVTHNHKKILSIAADSSSGGLISDFFDIKKEQDKLTVSDADKYTLLPGTIKKIASRNILITNKGTIVQLPYVFGASKTGKLQYIDDIAKFKSDPSSFNIKDKIILTDTYDAEMYPVVSAMRAKALIVFVGNYKHISTAYHTCSSFGIIFGYGKHFTKDALYKYLKACDGKYVWLDTLFNRLLIIDDKPSFIGKYEFDLDEIMGYK